MLTVFTWPVVRVNRASSGAGELTVTYLSVHSDLSRSMTSNMVGSRPAERGIERDDCPEGLREAVGATVHSGLRGRLEATSIPGIQRGM